MVVVLAIGAVVLVAALVSLKLSRPESEAILDLQRSLAALGDAVRPRSPSPVETPPSVVVTDHVHILDAPPTGRSGSHRRARPAPRRQPIGRHAKGRRRSAADIAGRPTIASLPTMVSVPVEWLPAPADPPGPEPAPVSAEALAFDADEGRVEPEAPRPVAW